MSKPPVFEIDLARFATDPYPALKTMRAQCPIAFVPQLGSILFTRRDDIATAEKNIAVFSSDQPEGLMNKLMGHNMMRKDGTDHQAEKKALFRSVSPITVRDHWTAVFQQHATDLIESLKPTGQADIVRDYALTLSANCLRSLTGLTNLTPAEMDATSQQMIDGISNYAGDPEIEAKCHAATQLLDDAIDDMANKNNIDSEPTLLHVMLESGMQFDSIRANIKLAISGGQNEPRDAISGATWALLTHEYQLQKVLSGDIAWLQVFEEYARWMSPIGMSPRRIATQHTFNEIDLTPGDRVFFMFGSGNRDETHFENADQFELARDIGKSIAFGAGPHFCAGAWASRAMIADVALPTLFGALKNLRIDSNQPPPLMGGWAFRGLLNLPVHWDS